MGRKSAEGLPPGIHKAQHGAFWATLEGVDAKRWKERYPGRTLPRRKAATLKAAREVQRQLVKAIETGRDPQAQNPTVARYVETWIAQKLNLKTTTRNRYTLLLKYQIAPHRISKLRLRQIDHNQDAVREWLAALRIQTRHGDAEKPPEKRRLLDAFSIRNAYAVLRAALNTAESDNLIAKNPCGRGIDLPTPEDEEIHPLTPDQVTSLFGVLDTWHKNESHRLRALYHIALRCGLRQGELIGLRLLDLNLKKRELYVRGQIQRGERTSTKGKRARTMILSADMMTMLHAHVNQLHEEQQLCGSDWNPEQLLFCTENGTAFHPDNLTRHFQSVLRRTKIPIVRFHDLRHTYASLSIAAGIDIHTLSRLMGHSSITVTANRYGHLYDESKQQAADLLDQFLKGEKE